MPICYCCDETTATGLQLCAGNHPETVCIVCALAMVQNGHTNCGLCRGTIDEGIMRELQRIIRSQQTTPPGLQNVRPVMDETTSGRSVRRRLEFQIGRDPVSDLSDFEASALANVPPHPCTDLLNHDREGQRFDFMTTAERFVYTNGVNIPDQPDPPANTGYAICVGAIPRYCVYKSTNENHLPPLVQGPLFKNSYDKVPSWARQHIVECKLFYARDQRVRRYNPWTDGHRPVDTRYSSAATRSTVTGLFTNTIKVSQRFLYQSYDNNQVFRSLAFGFALDCKLVPSMRELGIDADQFIDISPVYCSRSRAHPMFDMAEFDIICALSYKKEGHRWRSGPLLFLTYRRVVNMWSITDESKAVFASPDTPSYSKDFHFRGLVDSVDVYYNNLP